MRIALITDVHFGPATTFEGKLRKLSHHAHALTQEFVDRMNDVHRPDVVINLGDVIEDESAEADRRRYQEFLDLLDGLHAEVHHVAGNHDLVHLSSPAHPPQTSCDVGGVHLVLLCTAVAGAVEGHVSPEQLGWLERDLESTQAPVLVFSHHPLAESCLDGNRWFERIPWECQVPERAAVRATLQRSGKVRAAFAGHAHWNHLDVVAGIPYVTLQSLTENVDDDAPGRPARSYALVDVAPERLLVRVFGEEPARYQFDG
jgi:3',5'-cyclic-AMP phosphodiesterase